MNAAVSLVWLAVLWVAARGAFAQESTAGDSSRPLAYRVQNTGAAYATPTFAEFPELPIIRPLPDAFRFANGTRDTGFASWERRRNEIKAAIERYELGPVPDCTDCTITASYAPPASGSSKGTSKGSSKGTLTVNVVRKGKTLTLTSGVYVPQGMGSGPFAVLIPMELGTFSSHGQTHTIEPRVPDYGSLPASVFEGRPIATVGFVLTQVAGYSFSSPSVHTADPFYQLYPELCAGVCSGGSNSGEYAAWSWGVSRLIDGMEIASRQSTNPLPVDVRHLAVTGCSYAGKMALISGAFEERIALVIAQENGGGGAASWRVSHEIEAQGAMEDIDNTNYDWWGGQMHQFAGDNVYKLPEDHDELMDMVAPRALLETGNTDYYWLSNRSNYVSARATQMVYNAFGIGDRFGFYIDGGHKHCATLPAEAPAISAFVSKFLLGNKGTNTDVEVFPTSGGNDYSHLDSRRWTAWWGSDPNTYPQFPSQWNTGGDVVMSMDGLRPGPGGSERLTITKWTMVGAWYEFAVHGSHPASTVTLSGGNVQTDVRCGDGSSYTMRVALPNAETAIAAKDSAWVPGAGTYQGTATAPGCGAGVAGEAGGYVEGAYFSALGMNNGVGKPPLNPGISSTDTTDALSMRFSCNADGERIESEPLVVKFQP